jgi:transcriptional regulator with XRE-family HTH domain
VTQQQVVVDKIWFEQRMARSGLSLRRLAERMELDPSALSRTLNAKRKMTLAEARKLARILDAPFEEVSARASVARQKTPSGAPEKRPMRHPAWGLLKGTTIVAPGADLAEPTAPEWGRLDE